MLTYLPLGIIGAILHIVCVVQASSGDPTKPADSEAEWLPDLPEQPKSTGMGFGWFVVLIAALVLVGLALNIYE